MESLNTTMTTLADHVRRISSISLPMSLTDMLGIISSVPSKGQAINLVINNNLTMQDGDVNILFMDTNGELQSQTVSSGVNTNITFISSCPVIFIYTFSLYIDGGSGNIETNLAVPFGKGILFKPNASTISLTLSKSSTDEPT